MRIDIKLHKSNFNPHSHEGSDLSGYSTANGVEISIHTPTRGATERAYKNETTKVYFNPHSHEGSDYSARAVTVLDFLFQSTLPRGERLYCFCKFIWHFVFQSTLPRGERPVCNGFAGYDLPISIHTPTRGATS